MCAGDFNIFRDWRADPNITVESANLLTPSGWNIMQDLGQRYQSVFPTLLPRPYNRTNYLFRHTDSQRSQGSIRAFADGLFGENGHQNVVFEDIPAVDWFLRVRLAFLNMVVV